MGSRRSASRSVTMSCSIANHPRPLRLTLVNPPEPAKLLERLTKFLSEPRNNAESLPTLNVSIVATVGHNDRLIAAATLEGKAQDLVYEKVAAGRLELRVERQPFESLDLLVRDARLSRGRSISSPSSTNPRFRSGVGGSNVPCQ